MKKVPEIKNLFHNIPDKLPEELIEIIFQKENLRIERIVSKGHFSPPGFWYEQNEHEFVLLCEGEASIEFEKGETVHLTKGDYCLIPAMVRHRVNHTSEKENCVWLAIFFV